MSGVSMDRQELTISSSVTKTSYVKIFNLFMTTRSKKGKR